MEGRKEGRKTDDFSLICSFIIMLKQQKSSSPLPCKKKALNFLVFSFLFLYCTYIQLCHLPPLGPSYRYNVYLLGFLVSPSSLVRSFFSPLHRTYHPHRRKNYQKSGIQGLKCVFRNQKKKKMPALLPAPCNSVRSNSLFSFFPTP